MEHRHLTLMFTDIVGYSRLMARDQAQTIAMLEDYRRILLEEIAKYDGTVVEFIGDAVFARFDTPQAGVNAAVGIQKALFSFNHFRDKTLPRLQTRIGVHCGKVATKDNAFFGDDVNIAARLEPVAVADGICISDKVYREIKSQLREPLLPLGVLPLKNIESKIRGYLIRPQGITLRIRAHYANRRFQEKLGAYRYPLTACALIAVAAGIYLIPRWLVPGYDANYVEIADFDIQANTGESRYLGTGISEAVRAQLADMKDVYVLKTGEGIQAPVILHGSVQKHGDNLRVTYQISRRDGDVQIANGTLEGKYNEIFILQDRLVGDVAKYLAEEFNITNFRPARLTTTSDVLAYDYYLRGMEILNGPRSNAVADEAIKFFTTAIVHDSNYVDAEAGLCKAYSLKYSYTRDLSWLNNAQEHCDTALTENASHPGALAAMANIYYELGQYHKSIDMLSDVISRNPDDILAAGTLALAYSLNKQDDKALALMQAMITRHPKHWLGYMTLGKWYLDHGDIAAAITTYKQVLELTPRNSRALSNLGVAYSYLGELKKARQAFEESADIIPSSLAYTNLGSLNYFLGEYRTASDQFHTALQMDPQDFFLRINYADALRSIPEKSRFAKEQYEKAITQAKDIHSLNPNDLDANVSLALCYLSLENLPEANIYLQLAEQLEPTSPDVIYARLRYKIAQSKLEEAVALTGELLASGYSYTLLEHDPDLNPIKRLPSYRQIIAKN